MSLTPALTDTQYFSSQFLKQKPLFSPLMPLKACSQIRISFNIVYLGFEAMKWAKPSQDPQITGDFFLNFLRSEQMFSRLCPFGCQFALTCPFYWTLPGRL